MKKSTLYGFFTRPTIVWKLECAEEMDKMFKIVSETREFKKHLRQGTSAALIALTSILLVLILTGLVMTSLIYLLCWDRERWGCYRFMQILLQIFYVVIIIPVLVFAIVTGHSIVRWTNLLISLNDSLEGCGDE